MMQYVKWAAKAIVAGVTAGLGAIAAANLDVSPWVTVAGAVIIATLSVFLVPNGDLEL